MREIIFWGATGQAKVLRECLKDGAYGLSALFDNDESIESPFPDVPLYVGRNGFEQWAKGKPLSEIGFLVAIGGNKGRARIEIQDYLESYSLIPLTIVHPTAFVALDATIGKGSQILAHAAVCVEVRIGRGCIVNTAASVDHECELGEGVHVCPGAHLAGCIEVGSNVMIGTGAVVLPKLNIGEGAVIGAGAVVTKNVEPFTVVVGNPARVLRHPSD